MTLESILLRDSEAYEARRRDAVWNTRVPHRYPDAIAVPSDADGVAAVVRDAVREGKKVAVRSGGHNWLGAALRDGGILVDLGELTRVEVDSARAQARVGAGATNKILADVIVGRGLAFPIGHCPSVGLGGYLLSGGMGWNLRGWGPACWNVTGAEVVTHDGRVVRVDNSNEADLLWALRGGGSGFPGIVTSFYLDLFQLPQIGTRHTTYELSALPELLRSIANELKTSEPGLEISLIVRPPRTDQEQPARVIVAMTSFAGNQLDARARLEQCLSWIGPNPMQVDDSGARAVELNDLEGEGGWSDELRYAADTCWITDRLEALGGLIEEHILQAPSSDSRVVLAFGFLPPDRDVDTAFTTHGVLTSNIYATWSNSVDDYENIEWLRVFMSALSSLSSGAYIGEADTTTHSLEEAYPDAKLVRLREIMADYDPNGVFHGFLTRPEVGSSDFLGR